MYSFPFAPIQILTGDTREDCGSRHSWLHDDGRSFLRKPRIERRFESLPGSPEGRSPRRVFGYFLHAAKSNNSFPCRELRGFANLDSAHRNCGFARTKLKPSQRELRGSANLDSAHSNNNFALTQLNPLPPCLPPHGRLAHVRSQFSLFRRSPTHKNLPLATFCTSERAFWLLFARRKK